ncbi:MAG: Hpt domain-containing protein [Parvibaculum sp.]|nr:Hpt domain-containing protein [Parvibaculum sp.]
MAMTSTAKISDEGDAGYRDAARPLDLVHLAKYTFGDRALEAELLGLFRSQAGIYVTRLDTAASAKEWRDAAHSLKGSSRGLGAWALGDLAEDIEHLDFDDEAGRADAVIRLRAAILIVNVYIDELMS